MALYEIKHVHEIDIKLYLCVTQTGHLHTGLVAIENALNNRRTRIEIARNSVFEGHLSPVGRQTAIENSVSNYFDRSSILLTFSIATYPVCFTSTQTYQQNS